MENSTLNEYADMQKLNDLKQLIFSLNEENFDLSIQNTMNLFDTKFPYTFNIMISTYVFSAFYSLKNDCDIYLRYLHTLQEKEKELNKDNPKIMKIFTKYISEINIQEAYYLIEKMINKKLINSDVAKDINSNYFMHYKANQYVKNIVNCQFSIKIINNYDKLSNNDFELHKKLIAEGVNPNEISKIIRNDEIEKLQEISSETNFDYNQLIKPSLYERCSFINQDNISLIDFAAFFGAIKCFKFLLLNDAKINETGKYAVAGGNLEIIHLCAQNNSSFEGAYETAIKFHNNEIFRYIYENNLEELDKKAKNKKLNRPRKKVFNIGNQFDLYRNVFVNEDEPDLESDKINQLIRACSFSGNYEILSFLEEKGFDKPNKDIINDIAKIGNLYLIKHFLQKNQPSKDILIYSSQSGNNELIEYMLKQKGIDINAKNDGKIALLIASEKGNIEIVKLLLKQKDININEKGYRENTALILASENGHTEIVKLLLEQKGIDINAKNKDRFNALMKASENDYIDIVKLLLKQDGIDIYAKNKGGDTAYLLANRNGNIEIAKLLLEIGKFDLSDTNNNGCSAFMLAARSGHTEIVKFLLEQNGFDINARDKGGWTALLLASANNHFEVVKLLLKQKGIDINAVNYGISPFIMAAKNGSTEIIKLLLEIKGIDVNAKDNDGQTALMYASENGHTEIVKLLLEQEGIDINVKDRDGDTGLINACRNGHLEIVKLLLDQEGIDINVKDRDRWTALMCATRYEHVEIVKLLFEKKELEIDTQNDEGYTAFMIAATNNFMELVKLFIEHGGFDINVRNKNGETSLIRATYTGQINLIKLLLEQKGIDINAKDLYGNTALMIASERGGTNIVQIFLEQKGIDINAKNNDEMTAILLAAKNLRKGVVELLSNADGIEYDHQKIDEVSNPPQNNNGMNNLRNNMRINGVKIIPGHCTYEQTGRNFAYHQRYYLCETCKILPPYGVCEECAKVCHKGHFLLEVVNRPGSGGFFCDCGAGECLVQCKLMQNK